MQLDYQATEYWLTNPSLKKEKVKKKGVFKKLLALDLAFRPSMRIFLEVVKYLFSFDDITQKAPLCNTEMLLL